MIFTIDANYIQSHFAASFLLVKGEETAFVETATALCVPQLLAFLKAKGHKPENVRWIVPTHIHLDHAGGVSELLRHCPNATVLAHPRAQRHLVDPSKLIASASQVYGTERFKALYGEICPIDPARIRVMEDGELLHWQGADLQFLHTRGHANHHFCILDPSERVVFTGDSFGVCYPDLPGLPVGKQWAIASTSPTDFDGAAALQTVDRIVALDTDAVALTHFGIFYDIATLAGQLRRQLRFSMELVAKAQELLQRRLSFEETEAKVLNLLEDEVREDLRRFGCSSVDAAIAYLNLDITINAKGLTYAAQRELAKGR